MKPMIRFVILSALALVALLPVAASACSCASLPDPETALDQASAVFVGRVIALELVPAEGVDPQMSFVPEDLIATFVVSSMWKYPGDTPMSEDSMRISVRTAFTCCACGYLFTLGDTYLVYANGENDQLRTSICTRTALYDETGEDLSTLGEPTFWPVAVPCNDESQ